MPSRRRNKLNRVIKLVPEDLYSMLQEMRDKEVSHIKTTILTMEQKYAHYIASILDVKKRVSMELYSNMIDQVLDIQNKQNNVMNSYYQHELAQIRKENQNLIRQNQKHQKLIQRYQRQEIANRHTKSSDIKQRINALLTPSDTDTMNASLITDTPSENPFGPPFIAHDTQNPFQTMPKFTTDKSVTASATISSLTHTALPSDDGTISSVASDSDCNHDTKRDIKKRKKRKKKRKKHKEYKYKYKKNKDKQYLAPARHGDTDKTWLWCNHRRAGTDGVCGVNFVRTLKDRDHQSQHACDGDCQQKIITRSIGTLFKRCQYCDGSLPCLRTANIDEIEAYQKRLIDMNMVPRARGGYKVLGAPQTKSQPRIQRTGRQKKTRKKVKQNGEERRAVSVGFESMLPILNNDGAKSDDGGRTIWDLNDEDEVTVSDINMDNKPLKRRSRKRKRIYDSDASSDNERRSKKQKIDPSELKKLELDELLSKAFLYKENLEWDVEGKWCRYCGARGSTSFLPSLWGPHTLCHKHGNLWRKNELDLNNIVEPMDREHVVNKDTCTERTYLVGLIVKQYPNVSSYHGVDGRRRSLRNIKKEEMRFVVDSSSSESEGSYVGSSAEDDEEDEDDDEPIANRMNRIKLNGDNNNDVVMNNEQNDHRPHQSHDEDDDILGVD